ncbi:MAG TPA: glycosyltransferase family 2 protein, partial [Vicinamibacteria bacterium]|nr:glycosyltransferase family 2 protein [Vicinamibacteria bacterium]
VVVDDGSRDGTSARLGVLQPELGPRLQVVRHPANRGYGAALRSGFQKARGELVFYTDADNQFDLGELSGFMPLMEEWDAVFGYRARRRDPPLRLFTSRVFNQLADWALGLRVKDVNCSFKLFRGDLLRSLPLVSDDFMIDAELVARLQRLRGRVTEKPVTHLPRPAGRSTVRPWHVPRTLASLARLWLSLRRENGSAPAPR